MQPVNLKIAVASIARRKEAVVGCMSSMLSDLPAFESTIPYGLYWRR